MRKTHSHLVRGQLQFLWLRDKLVNDWFRVRSEQLHDYGIFSVRRDTSRSPRTGDLLQFHILHTADWVNVIPVTPAGQVVLIRQYRHGTGETALEIPGGVVDAEDESLAAAAARELEEETGYRARSVISLGEVAPNPAIQSNRLACFLAVDAERTERQSLDAGEDIEVVEVPLVEVPELIGCGRLSHALVIAAFQLLEIHRQKNPDLLVS